jgi:D-glycero-D-manno-heptose 1,7-bisphosphate phosphatase
MNKAVFLDRDGVINVEIDYVYKIEEFEFIENTFEALKFIQEKGYQIVIVTNQSGIARGFYTEEQFQTLTDWMLEKFREQGINVAALYYCPHHPEKGIGKYKMDCECRKPKPGMILRAQKDLDIDLEQSYIVGDKISDVQSGLAAGIKNGVLVKSGHKLPENVDDSIKIYDNLYDCATKLL